MHDPSDQSGGVDPELQAHIGRKLKASYDDILAQPVPDRFLDLLKALEDKEKSQTLDKLDEDAS